MAPKPKRAPLAERAKAAGLDKDELRQKEDARVQALNEMVGTFLDEHIDTARLRIVAEESLQRQKSDDDWMDWAVEMLQTLADLEWVYEFFPVLRERRKQLSGTLSGGEVQMLVIGRGLMAKPKMLMLDEPSAALAPKVVLEIFANINRIAKTGVTVLVVEQNVRMALILAQYGYIIRDGVIMIQGEAKKLISDPAVKDSFLGGSVANTSRALRN